MSTYCVSFRLGDGPSGKPTYAQRYEKLVQNVRTEGSGYWEETTAFFLVESGLDTNSFATKAVQGLNSKEDAVLIFDPSDMSAVFFGLLAHEGVLKSFFPLLRKLP